MNFELAKRRLKRRVLELVARSGYDVEKNPKTVAGYSLLRRTGIGKNAFADVNTILNGGVRCVFDVGAHIGQTAERLLEEFPNAVVYSFEPQSESFAELCELARASDRIRATNAAVGDAEGEAEFFVNRFSQTSSLLKTADGARQYLVSAEQMDLHSARTVRVLTLDRFCGGQGIERIDLLKIDSQGYELRVLEGARSMLQEARIPLIYLEVCFVRCYEEQPLFQDVYRYLYDRRYRLVWLYESAFHTHFYSVAANALFVHESLGNRAREAPPAADGGG